MDIARVWDLNVIIVDCECWMLIDLDISPER